MSGEFKAIDLTPYPDPALRALLAGFRADSIEPLSLQDGLSGSSYRIGDGAVLYHLRLWPRDAHPGQQQVPAQQAQRAASVNGLAPHILKSGDGWTFSSWIKGEVLSQRGSLGQLDFANMATLFSRLLHSSPVQHAPTHRLSECLHWYQQQLPPLDETLQPLSTLFNDGELSSQYLSIVHLDISPANIVDAGGFQLIDWEYAGIADWHWALANMLSHFSKSDQHVICDRLNLSGLNINTDRLAYYELGAAFLNYQWMRWQQLQQPELIPESQLRAYRCRLMQYQTEYLQGGANGTGHY